MLAAADTRRNFVGNDAIACVLEEVADLLEAQRADGFRVRAWRSAADTARRTPASLAELAAERGPAALDELPAIGKSIANAIAELCESGRLRLLDRLQGEVSAEELFRTLPGVGPELSERIHHELGVETLADLEAACHDGRLESLPGFGARRAHAIRDALALRLGRRSRLRTRHAAEAPRPSVALLLELDAEYRSRAEAGELVRIAPRRFNPKHETWLPILHATRDGWHVTALYSNTARAHELGTTHDWVVLFLEHDGREAQCTVVTETRGPLAGRRVVRGRERECRNHYGVVP